MIGQVTPGICRHQAMANWLLLMPWASASLSTPSISGHWLAGKSVLFCALYQVPSGIFRPPRVYVPASRPRASGAQRDRRDLILLAERQNLRLDPPIDDVQLRLLDIKPRGAQFLGHEMRLRQLPAGKDAAGQVKHLPLPDQIIQRPQRLIDRRIGIRPMNVIDVDPLGLEPPKRLLDFPHDMPATDCPRHSHAASGGHELSSTARCDRAVPVCFIQSPMIFFAAAIVVDVGGVDEVSAQFEVLIRGCDSIQRRRCARRSSSSQGKAV